MLNSIYLYELARIQQARYLAEAHQAQLAHQAGRPGRRQSLRLSLKMLALLLSLLLLAWSFTPTARVATYTVSTCGAAGVNDFRLAIGTANITPGPDEISLAPNCVYRFSTPAVASDAALPIISEDLTIIGNGATLERANSATQEFRLMQTGRNINLTLSDLIIRNGKISQSGAAIAANGNLTLNRVAIVGNTTTGTGTNSYGVVKVIGSAVIRDSRFEANSNGALSVGDGNGLLLDNTDVMSNVNNHPSAKGVVKVAGGSVTISNSRFVNNQTQTMGGGLYVSSDGPVVIANTSFKSNQAGISGGGAYIRLSASSETTGTLRLTNSSFENNKTVGSGDQGGGALYLEGDYGEIAEIERTTFRRNETAGSGGAVYSNSSISGLRIKSSSFQLNQAHGSVVDQRGGALYVMGGLAVEDSAFFGNSAQRGGGLYVQGDASVTGSLFSGNTARTAGGGLYAQRTLQLSGNLLQTNVAASEGGGLLLLHSNSAGKTSLLANNLWLRNTVTSGGALGQTMYLVAVSIGGGQVNVYHNTVLGNSPFGGIGLYSGNGSVTYRNNIITGFYQAIGKRNGTVTVDYNLFYHNQTNYDGVTAGENNLQADPLFSDDTTFQVSPASPANDNGIEVGVLVDRNGGARPQGDGFDIGAYEYGPVGPANQPPLAADDPGYTTLPGTALTVPATQGVLANDSDPDGDALQALLQDVPVIDAGQLTLNADGSFTYDPAPGFSGDYRFTYYASDGQTNSNIATVTVRVGANVAGAHRLFLPIIVK